VPRKPRLVGGFEKPNGSRGTIKNDVSFPGSPALWAGSFTLMVVQVYMPVDPLLVNPRKSRVSSRARFVAG